MGNKQEKTKKTIKKKQSRKTIKQKSLKTPFKIQIIQPQTI